MAVITVQANGVTTPDDWSLVAGASKSAAVNQPDDDSTSYVGSGTTSGTYQYFTCAPALTTGDTITQVKLYCRAQRGGVNDTTFRIGYTFTPNGGGTQTNEVAAGVLTAVTAWGDFDYTDSGLSVVWGSGFQFWVRNTQGRDLHVTTFYVEITYTPGAAAGLTKQAMYYAGMRG